MTSQIPSTHLLGGRSLVPDLTQTGSSPGIRGSALRKPAEITVTVTKLSLSICLFNPSPRFTYPAHDALQSHG